jgi:hypothetical protein
MNTQEEIEALQNRCAELSERCNLLNGRCDELSKILRTPRFVTFGWGGNARTYIIIPGKVIHMSDASFTDVSAGDSGILTFTDLEGNVVVPTTPPVWTPDDGGTIATLTVAADGLSANATPASDTAVGVVNVSIVAANAANGDGSPGPTVTLATTITVNPDDATAGAVAWSPIVPAVTPPAPTA